MHVEYVNTQRPSVTRAETRDSGCERLRNGLVAREDCCDHCRALLRQCAPRAYRIFDADGRVIRDWHIH